MAIARLVPSTYSNSNASYVTVTNPGNMYNNTDHTGSYCTLRGRAGRSSNSTYYAFIHGFNFDSVPSNATVTGFRVLIKAYRGSYQATGNTNYRISLASQASNSYKIGNTTLSEDITTSTSGMVYEIPTDSLTWSQLVEYGSGFSIDIPLRNSSTSSSYYPYVYVYGAEIEVTYIVPHTVISVNNTDLVDSIDPEGSTEVNEGDSYTLVINANDISGVSVEDNGNDVTSQLVRHNSESGQHTVSKTADSFTTGFSGGTNMNFYTAQNTTGNTFNLAVGHTAENPSTGSSVWTYVKSNNGSTSETGYADFVFDFSDIPINATINSVQVKCYGAIENASQSNSHADITLFSGSTQKSTLQKFTSSTNSSITISSPGTWTREELQEAKLRFAVGYYGGRIFGITWNVTYTVTSVNPYYWTYTLSNITSDHTIIVSQAIVIPPDEDPQKTYYPITISSINASTDPGKGTNRIESGTSETITIYPSDPLITLITDNGVDVSSQLVAHGGTIPNPTVTTASGASYGFNLNSSTGYYVSSNTGVDKSAAVCVVNFNLPVRCLVTISYINYAESTYDFGIFGNIDSPLTNNYKPANGSMPDSDYKLACNTSSYNTNSVQTITYEIPSGEHQVYIKYSKDDATSSNNDSLQWKISSIEALESNNYYTYTLSNVNQEHSLIFIFGDVTYYFVNSSTTSNCKLYPNGSMVQLPGDEYSITIVPNDINDAITIRDNNTDVTSSLQSTEAEIEKDGNTVTVVNYIYKISNVQATHNITVYSASGGRKSYIYSNGAWHETTLISKQDNRWSTITYTKVWVKNGSTWVESPTRTIVASGIIFKEN